MLRPVLARQKILKIRRRERQGAPSPFARFLPQHRIVNMSDGLGQTTRQLHFGSQRIQIRRWRFMLNPEIEEVARGRNTLLKIFFAFGSD